MKHTEFGHSISFIAQNWDKYSDFAMADKSVIGHYVTPLDRDSWQNDTPHDHHMDVNTWESWHLIPESRPTLPLPKQKRKVIDGIPNTNGSIDLSLKDTGYPVYENREGTFNFIYNPIYSYTYGDYRDWTVIYSEISNFIHGRQLRMVLEDDPEYYWDGSFTVEGWTSNTDGSGSVITIGYSVQPHKLTILSSLDAWLWDPFNFYNGAIQNTVFNNIEIAVNSGPGTSDDWTGFNNTKSNILEDDSRWVNVPQNGLYGYMGTKPLIPIIWWSPTDEANLHKKLIVNYINESYNIDYTKFGTDKYKYYNPAGPSSNAVSIVKTYTTEQNEKWYLFKDNDLIFCDGYTGDLQYIQFIGKGKLKIDFRRGSL